MGLLAHRYWIEGDDLCIADDKQVTWRGRPDNAPARSLIEVPESNGVVVLLDYAAGPRNALGDLKGWANLIRVSTSGQVVWRATPTDPRDVWTAAKWKDGKLLASTFAGWMETLDYVTGRSLARLFAK